MNYYVYILRCSDNTFYTGFTIDLEKRIKEHNGEKLGGARYTRPRRPVKVVYREDFKTQRKAMQREIEIKNLTRKEKEALVKKGELDLRTAQF